MRLETGSQTNSLTTKEQKRDESVSCAAEFYLNIERESLSGNADDEARLTDSTKWVEPEDRTKTKGELMKRSVHERHCRHRALPHQFACLICFYLLHQ